MMPEIVGEPNLYLQHWRECIFRGQRWGHPKEEEQPLKMAYEVIVCPAVLLYFFHQLSQYI